MKPFGLKRRDCTPRPHCSCCTTHFHGNYCSTHSCLTKANVRRVGAKRGRAEGKQACKED